jgi:hypothetical protein
LAKGFCRLGGDIGKMLLPMCASRAAHVSKGARLGAPVFFIEIP